MSTWKLPPRAKVYEALSAIGDNRVTLYPTRAANVKSSSGDKNYTVEWSEDFSKVTSNDNASFWQGYLGYPILAVLLKLGRLQYDPAVAKNLAGIHWKKINDKFKRDYEKAIDFALNELEKSGVKREPIDHEVNRIMEQLKLLAFEKLSSRLTPPKS